MRLQWGRQEVDLQARVENRVPLERRAPAAPAAPVSDIPAAVHAALENPIGFPPLRRALTPDDQIAIAVDESLIDPARFLVPILEHLQQAHIAPEAITLLCQPPSTGQLWLENLPDEFQEVRVEMHDPATRAKLAYLATTRKGRRIYLNRTAVDADQLIVLNRLTYDPLLGQTTGEGFVFPGLADAETRSELFRHLSLAAPGAKAWPVRQEAAEVAWLLGAPFLVQVVPGAAEEVAYVQGGPVESSDAGVQRLDERWRVEAERPADVVIATISGVSAGRTLLDLGRAFQAASRIVKPGGQIVLLTEDAPPLGPAAEMMRGAEDVRHALRQLLREKPADLEAGFLWSSVAEQARLYLLSGLDADMVEEMFATPLQEGAQVQRFLGENVSFVVLPDAHQTLAVLRA